MSVVRCAQCGVKIDYRSVSNLCREHFLEAKGNQKLMPDDFPAYSVGKSYRELCPHYGISRSTLTIWRRQAAIQSGKRLPWSPEEDEYLRDNIKTLSIDAIAAELGRSSGSVKGRVSTLQLKTGRPQGWQRRELSAPLMAGHSGEAAYLQAFGPIYRCHKDGTQAAIGAYWHWAGQILTHDEMEAKARAHRERKKLLAA